MTSGSVSNPVVQAESKSARKKKAVAAAAAAAQAAAAQPASPMTTPATLDGKSSPCADVTDDSTDPPHIRELQKNIRNTNKKLTNASKTDSIIAQHPGKSLDDLVSMRVINVDQKAQQQNKQPLHEKLAEWDQQIAFFRKIEDDNRKRVETEKSRIEASLTKKFEQERAEAVAEAEQTAAAASQKEVHHSLLTLSQFLRLAAARRQEEPNSESDENLALEGILLQVYTGNDEAVAAMKKLIKGSADPTVSVAGASLQTSYAQVKQAAATHSTQIFDQSAEPSAEAGGQSRQESAPTNGHSHPEATLSNGDSKLEPAPTNGHAQSDPTLTNASLTEIDSGAAAPFTNGQTEASAEKNGVPANSEVAPSTNAAGESHWGNGANGHHTADNMGDVSLPRDPAETDNGLSATPEAAANIQNSTEAQPAAPATQVASTNANGGSGSPPMQQRSHRGGRGSHDGGYRGRGGWRGRGFRGDGRGRGRGAGRGGPRGGRRGGDE